MTGYEWRDSARVPAGRLDELRRRDAPAPAAVYLSARQAGLRVWEAAIAAGVSQSVGRRLERARRRGEPS